MDFNLALGITGALVFLGAAVLDACWTIYIHYVGKKDATSSAVWSGAIMFISALVTVQYVGNPGLIGSAVAGAVFGTYYTVAYLNKKGRR